MKGRWMEVNGNGDKEMVVYDIFGCKKSKECVIHKSIGYLSHVKLYGNSLIMVQDHTNILVLLLCQLR